MGILIAAVLVLVVLGGIIAVGGARKMVGNRRLPDMPGRADVAPDVAVVIPISGSREIRGQDLASVLRQDYPAYDVVFSSMAGDECAGRAIEEAMTGERGKGCRAVRHAIAEPATGCSQKNMNLLAGVSAVQEPVPILVFCDSGHDFPAHWLRRLVRPLIFDGASVSSSYHRIIPGDDAIGTHGHAVTLLFLHLMSLVPMLSQAWGGSTACKRELFDKLMVRDMWSRAVVDDVSLSRLLNQKRIRIEAVPSADADTRLAGQTTAGWSAWLTRQLMYMKLYYPVSWLVGGITGMLIALSMIWFAVGVLLWAAGVTGPATGILCCAGLAIVPCLIMAIRILHPAPGARLPWLCGGIVAVFMACWCHSRTWFSKKIAWRGVEYVVLADGTVAAVKR